jgi:hypothetical protein
MAETKPLIKTIKTIELLGDKPPLMIQESEYKGNPVLNIVYVGPGFPTVLKFGPGKVKMALWSTEEMLAFHIKHMGKLPTDD